MRNLKALSICFFLLTCQTTFVSGSQEFDQLQEFDRELLQRVSYNRSAALDLCVESVSLVSPIIEYGAAVELGVSGYLSDDEDALDIGIVSLSSLLATNVFCVALKYTVNRERPHLGKSGYHPRLLNIRLTPSFPSGHTASSFAFATALSSEYPEFQILLFGYAVISGFSQVYVGNHYPLDVLAGAILGYGISTMVINHRDKLSNTVGLETRQKSTNQDVKITFFRAHW